MAEKDNQETPRLEAGQIKSIERNDSAQLVLHAAGLAEPILDVRVARCFPWSIPESYISIRSSEGREICLLKGLGELEPASRAVVEAELSEKIFNPKIQRVTSCKSEFGVASIVAATDRGEVTFQIRSRDDVRVLSPTRALFRDVDGNTYELADLAALDRESQKHFHPYF